MMIVICVQSEGFRAEATATIPSIWKMSTIIPVPEKLRPTELKHYRPVALISIIMKCLEQLLLNTILPAVNPFQFAYKTNSGTEDAVASLLHLLLQHLDSPAHFAPKTLLGLQLCF